MGAATTAIVGDFSVSDLLREAAERSIALDVTIKSSAPVQTPSMSGMLKADEVQPGLLMSGYDITYLSDGAFAVDVEPSVLCTVLLDGQADPMTIEGHPPVSHLPECVEVLGFGSRLSCARSLTAGQRSRAFGITVRPAFLERFASSVADGDIAPLGDFLAPGFRRTTLPRLANVLEIANQILDHPYGGGLASLYHESHSLRFLLEIAIALKDQERLRKRIGQLEHRRACKAREILDGRLVDPPKALDLAREVGVNLTTLQANFKAVFGTTIFGYVRAQRLKMSRIMIIEHGLRVAEAGLRVGFSNPAAFTAAYRRHFGHPPTVDQGRRLA